MSAPTPTLHQVLARGLSLRVEPSRPTCYRPGLFWIPPTLASAWEGFTLDNIMAAYGDILERPTVDVSDVGAANPFKIASLNDVRDMMEGLFHSTMPRPLETGRQRLASRLGLGPDPIKMSQTVYVGAGRPTMTLRSNRLPLIAGAVRMGWEWSSETPLAALLFDQLLGYANEGNTRYGFAATDAEFVVTQAYKVDNGMGIRYHAIPIDASGMDRLTPALALWCLSMMALNPHHRTPGPEEETYSFNTWYVDVRESGEVTYMHHLSRVVRSTIPPSEGLHLLPRPQSE
jgi:hypothetical protein